VPTAICPPTAAVKTDGNALLAWLARRDHANVRAFTRIIPLPEKIVPFLIFMLVGAITPGPNNMISTASGAAFGYARTVPQMLGVSLGFPVMIVAVGLGLGEVLRRAPWLHDAVRIGGALFLLYFAWRIARAAGPEQTEARKPFTLIEAALFQWLNPKSWTFAVGTIAAFTTPGLPFAGFLAETGTIAVISGVLAFVSLSVWCLFGVMIGRLLADERKRRIFQYALAVLLAMSIVFLFV
jgi:threonine/homoserine/homoserine lactone efflux protein